MLPFIRTDGQNLENNMEENTLEHFIPHTKTL